MNTIVVGIDQSTGSQQALEWALAEAQLRGAAVRLVHVVPSPETYYPYSLLGQLETGKAEARQAASDVLASALAKAGGAPSGVTVELTPRLGVASKVLVDEASDAALLVVGSRGRGGFTGLLLGSVSQQVLQHARCPVLVVPHQR